MFQLKQILPLSNTTFAKTCNTRYIVLIRKVTPGLYSPPAYIRGPAFNRDLASHSSHVIMFKTHFVGNSYTKKVMKMIALCKCSSKKGWNDINVKSPL